MICEKWVTRFRRCEMLIVSEMRTSGGASTDACRTQRGRDTVLRRSNRRGTNNHPRGDQEDLRGSRRGPRLLPNQGSPEGRHRSQFEADESSVSNPSGGLLTDRYSIADFSTILRGIRTRRLVSCFACGLQEQLLQPESARGLFRL